MTERPRKEVKLSRTYAVHDKAVSVVWLKEPTADDYFAHGEIFDAQKSADGAEVIIENGRAVEGYILACIDGIEPAMVGTLSLTDARRLRRALLDFFRLEEPSKPGSATSSSTEDGPTTASAA